MKCLVVVAHPLAESLCHVLCRVATDVLAAAGHEVEVLDLYEAGFAPALTETERASYYQTYFAREEVSREIDQLMAAEAIVLVFPTWWFGFPAILKGWFDRVWAPGAPTIMRPIWGRSVRGSRTCVTCWQSRRLGRRGGSIA